MQLKSFWMTAVLAIVLASVAGAQVWNEQGDAGDLPETAQSTSNTSCSEPLTQINGNLDASDVDMYAICITDPASFSATTVGGATFDTQLFLFDADGKGVTSNDDEVGGTTLQSRITGQFIPAAGTYYLAISRYNRDPLGCGGGLIWNSTPFRSERAPDGPESTSRVASWSGTTLAGSYSIFLTGASLTPRGPDPDDCPPPPPTTFTLTDGDATITLRGISGAVNRTGTGGGSGDYFSLGGGLDHLFQNWWWFRVDSSTREFALSRITTLDQPAPNRALLTYEETSENLRIQLEYLLTDAGDDQAIVQINYQVTNTAGNAQTVNLFNYSDFDINGSSGGDTAELLRDGYIRAVGEGTTTVNIVASQTPTAWEIAAYASLLTKLTNTSVDDLSNSGSPFGPGDFTGAFQWTFSLQPNANQTGTVRLAVNIDPGGPPPLEGDVNRNGCVDDVDLHLVLKNVGSIEPDPPGADVNGDGIVNQIDVAIVLANFGRGNCGG